MVAPTTPVIKLHRVLQRTPSLRQHCRCLSIHISDILAARSPHHFDIVNDFARWLTRVRCLSVHGGFEEKFNNPHTWALIRNLVVNMREVEHATISREWFGLYLGPIMRNIEFPKLRELNIHGISHSKKEITILDPKKHRTASFTALSISDYEESPGSTALLIQWPTTLVHFEFGSFYNNPHIMDLPMFQSWLFIHRETLKNINIGYLSRAGSKRLFDATFFPNLESLQLSRWQMERPLQFTAEDANVLGPKVKLFGWDFSIYDQHNEGWDDFGENEESWISELGKAAVARQSSLKTIAIYFGPDHWGAGKKESYPWDRMDSVRDGIMRPNGMDLVYNRPCISREEWLAERRGGTKAESISLSDLNMQEAPESASADESESESDTLVMAEPGFYGRDIRWYFAPVQRPWNISELRG
ncbi:uncharacterized protein BDR25DRAFT_234971 [Lindgomyces ingoldianus]|uniref:Uncharacterized protein n=1 Tax=Lindgomyces ingoldianus TaxID=673940 RepID=A0ACB6QMF8_9PLEO|nr:uncharacterized protein BDR25DRAFT_234971 [Lindgomyces ingoldianus]KAF2467331.1 hypothetical protein BDR25DRAFT_234971 [Lindgomyces ingoldianus]